MVWVQAVSGRSKDPALSLPKGPRVYHWSVATVKRKVWAVLSLIERVR
jgi:hypothetical protein